MEITFFNFFFFFRLGPNRTKIISLIRQKSLGFNQWFRFVEIKMRTFKYFYTQFCPTSPTSFILFYWQVFLSHLHIFHYVLLDLIHGVVYKLLIKTYNNNNKGRLCVLVNNTMSSFHQAHQQYFAKWLKKYELSSWQFQQI